MNTLEFPVEENTDRDALKRIIGFASEEILSIDVTEGGLVLQLNEKADTEAIKGKVETLLKRYSKEFKISDEIVLYSQYLPRAYEKMESIYNSTLVKSMGNGMIALTENATGLFKFFDNCFKQFALDCGAIEKIYPTLLPIESYRKTGYLKTSPQYAIFCCSPNEDMDKLAHIHTCSSDALLDHVNPPQYALSPAACFHSYLDYENGCLDKPMVVTFNQNVFRQEGRLNWTDFGRLRDYHVREIVFFGDRDYVNDLRERLSEKTKQFMDQLGLNGKLTVASDPFVLPSMHKFKKIQILEQSKYELQLAYTSEKHVAVASFNIHGTTFTHPFNIKISDCEEPVTGCVGFGIERWILAFLSQYGLCSDKWPKMVTQNMKRGG